MKKSRLKKFKKHFKYAFWLFFVLGAVWVAFAPPMHRSRLPAYTVRVQQPVFPAVEQPQPSSPPVVGGAEISSGGEEATQPPPPGHGEGVTIPVVPEPPVAPSGQRPKIAIVIDDVGPDFRDSEKAIRLPSAVTLSFLPYAVRVRDQSREAREAGHELLLHMPMEPVGHENPGPGALLIGLPLRDIQQRFEAALASFTGFDGVNNHMGSKFTAYPEGMGLVMDELQQRQLFWLDSRTGVQSIGAKTAKDKGVPAIERDVFLDDDPSPEAIQRQLALAERVARRKGHAVAIGHPHASTLAVLKTWTEQASARNIDLVPLRDLVER